VKLLLIRHAESAPDKSIPDELWPLSQTGTAQADALVNSIVTHEIDKLYSSPYARAVDTVRPIAISRSLEILLEPDLRERKLSDGLIDNWIEVIERSWADRDFKLPGCESARECQDRVFACIERILPADSTNTIAACSHGNAIALFINRIEPSFGFEAWRAMRNPHVFEFVRANGAWTFNG
jgi:2,3-bisphosphoglycerate-dependent phosphoglycerate mutase